jgi:hypothetical protein
MPRRFKKRSEIRAERGAIYTVSFLSIAIPLVLILANMILQAALTYYVGQRLDFVANETIDHFDSLAQIDQSSFNSLFSGLASANDLKLRNVKSLMLSSTESGEEALKISISGSFANDLGIFTAFKPFAKTYNVKVSRFDTLGYLAVNGYPFCEINSQRNLSAYLPIYRPSPALPTWQFSQDTAIGMVRETIYADSTNADRKPSNWRDLADGLVSIY